MGVLFRLYICLTTLTSLSVTAWGAINSEAGLDRLQASIKKKHRYIENGTIIGGEAGTQTSVLNLRRLYAPKDGIERIVLDMGDPKGQPLKGQVGYFHLSLDRAKSKLILVLDHTQNSAIDQKKLQEIFKASPFVKNARILFDPLDRGITIDMDLKRSIAVEAFQLPSNSKTSRLVLDLRGKKSS